MTATDPARFRALPSVDRLLSHPALLAATAEFGHAATVDAARAGLIAARLDIARGEPPPDVAALAEQVAARLAATYRPTLRGVINATGVILHTNLGRAPLARSAIEAMTAVAAGYSNLEFDLASGGRGSRTVHAAALLARLTGAEAALVVNNCASAVLLALTALASGREAIVSRGQAVEIGGGFRIPDVMRQSGATLVEVGTTNRTYARDYADAITDRTALLLRVHSSNFRIEGFTHTPTLAELAEVAHAPASGVLLMDDLGSGALLDTAMYGLTPEPTARASIAAGADIVLFSGDKLLGGPQAGIIIGRAEVVERLRRHPLARAVRTDKLSLAALQATLLHYLRGDADRQIPVWRMIATPLAELDARAHAWAAALTAANHPIPASVIDGHSTIGGGSLPGETLPTRLLCLDYSARDRDPAPAAARLRQLPRPIIARVDRGHLLLDPRTVAPGEDGEVMSALQALPGR